MPIPSCVGTAFRTAIALLALAAAPAVEAGEIYRWTDAQGRLHFTQSLDQVPPEHRAAARFRARQREEDRVQRYSTTAQGEPGEFAARRSASFLSGTLDIPFRRHGSLMVVDVKLNDALTVPFYVDTGASGLDLPRSVADRLGIRITPETRHVYVRTANGVASRPVITLRSVQLDGARVENLDATVNPTMEIGLLGGSFFNNFVYRVDAAAGVITLQKNDALRGGLGAKAWRERFVALRQPLARLEAYLDSTEVTRSGRRAELEGRRDALRRQVEALEDEANRLDVPMAWRE